MTKMATVLLFQKDYTEKGGDRYFIFDDAKLSEIDAVNVANYNGPLICHDYWLIAPSLHKAVNSLPKEVIDLDVFDALLNSRREKEGSNERKNFKHSIKDICDKDTLEKYFDGFTRKYEFNEHAWAAIAGALLVHWGRLCLAAGYAGELERCLCIEFPVFNFLIRQAVRGIRVDLDRIKKHRLKIDHDFYSALRNFGVAYDLPFEVPKDVEVEEYLEKKGFDFSGVSLDYVLRFVPMQDDFSQDLINLKKLSNSRSILWSLSLGRLFVSPMVDVFGSRTSRIYLRDPSIQGLAKRHRDVIVPDEGFKLSYVDYDQFEVGIMAALSGDEELKRLFALPDLYVEVARVLFGSEEKRKFAKRIFLSYAYGMPKHGLLSAAHAQGASRSVARTFFAKFQKFEAWKRIVESEFFNSGRIGTTEGNFFNRVDKGLLTEKEKRSAVSQVVQGTASLVFKKALLRLSQMHEISLKMPMHDAILFQHLAGFDPSAVAKLMADVLTEHFGGRIAGKASVDSFF